MRCLSWIDGPARADKRAGHGGLALGLVLACGAFLAAGSTSLFGQGGEMDFGDAPLPYPTWVNDNGARHVVDGRFFLGAGVDIEPDGQPDANALGDDRNPSQGPDDEDGVTFVTYPLQPGQRATIRVVASLKGRLDAWVDFDRDGKWVPQETIFAGAPLIDGTNTLSFDVPAQAVQGTTYARFRFSEFGDLQPTGAAGPGEVEDYQIEIGGQFDFGDAPQSYPTTLANNGARHRILQGFILGEFVDAESDGRPTVAADGDDRFPLTAPDDEDGVNFLSLPLEPGASEEIEVTAPSGGALDAWVDFNGDGTWDNRTERIFLAEPLARGTTKLSFRVPANIGAVSSTYARFRLSSKGGLPPDGPASEGEVEDYRVSVAQPMDFGDAPDSYATTLSRDGARHAANPDVFLGRLVDLETDGQPSTGADGDDTRPAGAADDEDGVTFTGPLRPGSVATVVVTASTSGQLSAWVDFAGDGSFAQAGDQIFTNLNISGGPNTLSFVVPSNARQGDTYARFRFTIKGGTSLTFRGAWGDGEVEDYKVTIQDLLDYGDAPDPTYPTLRASDGARHRRNPDVFLGLRIDEEPDGQPTVGADGDDNNPPSSTANLDDEDGVFIDGSGLIYPGQQVTMLVRASTRGFVNAWVDFDRNGSWAEPSDQIFKDVLVTSGTNSLTFTVPADAVQGLTYARIRFNLKGGLTYTGLADDGEVEDYAVRIIERPVPCERTNKGTDFWLTFPGNYAPDPDNPLRLSLCIVGPAETLVGVQIPGLDWQHAGIIDGSKHMVVDLPPEADLGDANDEILNNGIHVFATREVAVFGMSRVRYTTDGYLALPSDVLGKAYVVQAFGNSHEGVPSLNGTQLGLVACEDRTAVTIIRSTSTTGHAAGAPYIIQLDQGQTYQLRNTNDAPNDLSGTLIIADKPIAVFGSHRCANVPDKDVWFCDYLVEQLLPVVRADHEFVTMPLATRTGDTFRFYSVLNGSQVFVNGSHVATLNLGEFHQMTIASPAHIVAEGAIFVNQLANSSDFDMVRISDPFQLVVPPVSMWREDYEICAPDSGFDKHYINVVVPKGGQGIVTLDGTPIPAGDYVPIPGGAYFGAQVQVTPGVHFLASGGQTGGRIRFGVSVYGWAEYDSYGFPGGMYFSDRTPPTLICPETNIVITAQGGAAAPCAGSVPDLRQYVLFTDNCPLSPNAFVVQNPEPGSSLPPGDYTITLSVTDDAGNTGSCTVPLTILDASPPTIDCPADRFVSCTSGQGAVVEFNVPAFTACGTPLEVKCEPPSGSLFPPGTTTVSCTAVNAAGQTATCTFNVTVQCLGIAPGEQPGTVVVTWNGGTLQTALSVDGPWVDLQNAASPFIVGTTNRQQYFRVKF